MGENFLNTINLQQLGNRLQQARKKQGLTQVVAARIIGVARTTLTAIEKGERRIKASELMKLAEAYGRQVSDFVHDRPQIELSQVQFRSTSSIMPEDEAHITEAIDILLELCTNYLELEQIIKNCVYSTKGIFPRVMSYSNKWTYTRQLNQSYSNRYNAAPEKQQPLKHVPDLFLLDRA